MSIDQRDQKNGTELLRIVIIEHLTPLAVVLSKIDESNISKQIFRSK